MSGSVLIIDGDQAFAETAQNALEAAGLEVWVRQDGTFDTVRELRPHVLLLNVELPRGSGFSICSRIRRDKALKATPIFLTSSATTLEALQQHAQSADSANDYAMKPIAIDDVVDRVGKLIATRPPPLDVPGNGAPAAPPPIPPPLKKTAPAEETPPPVAATPENTPIPTAGLGSDDLWPSLRYDDAMRLALTQGEESMPKGRVSPEERLQALRSLVKQHEQQKRVFQETWQRANERGQELARRIVGLTSELENRDVRITEVRGELAEAKTRLEGVEGEFRTFQDEITRIFKEKDAEESSRATYLAELEAAKQSHTEQLQAAFERQTDDERRLNIIQEDLDLLQNEKDEAAAKLAEVEDAFAQARDHIEGVEQRLEMTNEVAAQRADEVKALEDKVDQLAFERNSERQGLKKAHQEKVDQLLDEHETKIEALLSEHVASMEREREIHQAALDEFTKEKIEAHAAEIADLNEQHANLVDALNLASESEINDATQRIAELTTDRNDLHERAQTFAADLEEEAAARTAEVGQLTKELAALKAHTETLENDLADQAANNENVGAENRALQTKLAETTAALQTARGQIQALDADLDEERTTSLERAGQLSSIESELDTAQAQLFERMSELDHTKKQVHAIETRAKDLETSLKTTEKVLKTTDAEGRAYKTRAAETEAERIALEQQVELLEEQHSRLKEKLRDTHAMLEDDRAHLAQSEEKLRRATETVAAFEADDSAEQLSRELAEEREVRGELEASLRTVQAERQQLETDVADLTRERAELDEQVDSLEQSVARFNEAKADLERALEASEERYEETESERREVARSADDASKVIAKLEAAKKKLKTALAEERSAREDLQESVESQRATQSELQSLFDSESEAKTEVQKQVEALEQQLTMKEAELADLYSAQTDAERRMASTSQGQDAQIAELKAQVDEKSGQLANLETMLAASNEELEIHRAQSQGLSQTADRAEQAHSDVAGQLEAARRTVATLEKSENALLERISTHEDVINEWRFATESMKSTLAALQRDIETANSMTDDTAAGKSFDQLMGRIARAVSMCMETLDESDESMDLPSRAERPSADIDIGQHELDDDDEDDDIPIYTGEVETLDPLSDLEQDGLQIIHRTPVTPAAGRSSPPRRSAPSKIEKPPAAPEEPFAALMAELSAVTDEPNEDKTTASGFQASFEGERTTTDNRALTSKSAAFVPTPDDDEEDERDVTEIINIHELE